MDSLPDRVSTRRTAGDGGMVCRMGSSTTGRRRRGLVMGLALAASVTTAAPLAARPLEVLDPAHVDVLFIGAHPDDEFQSLAALGQWQEDDGLRVGVATITRGEGGGNAVGEEEGAALGLLREAEEREAVGLVGIDDVHHLDKPDFWYTLSAPLTIAVWDGPPQRADTLERLVRLVRATTPDVVVTMDPRPLDQHGAHQAAGRLATEAFLLAGDPSAFPSQLTAEGYRAWRPDRLLAQNRRFAGPTGPACEARALVDPAAGLPVEGVWEGTWSRRYGRTWAQRERDAARAYASQGFAALPPTVDTPVDLLPCDWFTVLAENGTPVPAAATGHDEPRHGEFAGWARRVGLPTLARDAGATPPTPATTIHAVGEAPRVDGVADDGEYPAAPLDLVHWQGPGCRDTADCSARARLSRHGDDLYAHVDVTDDVRGTALAVRDCKRHWRTDAVEIALDPRGASADTSTTFKLAVLPFTAEGGSCAARDADQHQGPAPEVEHAAVPRDGGYSVEVRVPVRALPDRVDPTALTLNVLVYDSDTRDRTGRTRLAWSPSGSAQADPRAWGTARLEGYDPPPRDRAEPVI
ncbi:PIG-L family deacetylase, partial [Saccharothrix sp. MB29]|nr:PIG-L family deacetylase [Saccharothrix sp. MB29]